MRARQVLEPSCTTFIPIPLNKYFLAVCEELDIAGGVGCGCWS
jgi:hypothetical protein